VTNLAAWTPRHVGSLYHKRWAIELRHRELQTGLGVGEPQVRGTKDRSEKAVGMAVLAYWLVLRVCQHAMVPGQPWSMVQLQHALRLRAMTNQGEHQVTVKMAKTRKAA
jgi:hypothetical protein